MHKGYLNARELAAQAGEGGALELVDDSGCKRQNGEYLNLEVPITLLEKLIEDGALCAAQVRCLDVASRKKMKHLCLRSCAKRCLMKGSKISPLLDSSMIVKELRLIT